MPVIKAPEEVSREVGLALRSLRSPETCESTTLQGTIMGAELLSQSSVLPRHCVLRLKIGSIAVSPRLLWRLGVNVDRLYVDWDERRLLGIDIA